MQHQNSVCVVCLQCEGQPEWQSEGVYSMRTTAVLEPPSAMVYPTHCQVQAQRLNLFKRQKGLRVFSSYWAVLEPCYQVYTCALLMTLQQASADPASGSQQWIPCFRA